MHQSSVQESLAAAPRVAARREQRSERLLTPEILSLAAVVVLGSIMTILDATIVNVALPTLGRDFHTSITTIQWVPTIYLLAFAMTACSGLGLARLRSTPEIRLRRAS